MRLHSWLSNKCEVQTSRLDGFGVFATDGFRPGEVIAIWGGVIYSAQEIDQLGEAFPHFRTHPFQVAEGFFMGSTSLTGFDDAERFNHSCDPNVGVKGQIIVVARREILGGEELTFDYETTDIAPAAFTCRCHSPRCRRTIDGSAWRTTAFQNEHANYLSWFVAGKVHELKALAAGEKS